MSKVLKAEYDDTTNSLHLLEPIDGIADHEVVSVTIDQAQPRKRWSHPENGLTGENGGSFGRGIDEAGPIKPPWSDLRGLLSGEEGEKFARDIEEAFPTEPVRK
jgi:hypothetical protein